MRIGRWVLLAAGVAAVAGLTTWAQLGSSDSPETWTFRVIAAYPHDPNAFTQGLVLREGELYEGTGQYGASSVRRVDLATGRVEKQRALNPRYFGEGITILDGRLYQLTWQNQAAIVYDLATFDVLQTFQYPWEGWGLTHDGMHLVASDGTASLRFLDPQTLELVRTIEVRDGEQPLDQLNELEYVDGEIWANIWHDDRIARISPDSGKVLGFIDLAALFPRTARDPEAVLNGIAFDPAAEKLLVTGKNWPQLFEIEVVRPR
jgi:glutaminyl-peptide cyclotransferase